MLNEQGPKRTFPNREFTALILRPEFSSDVIFGRQLTHSEFKYFLIILLKIFKLGGLPNMPAKKTGKKKKQNPEGF